ncbi:MAG: endo-1,4-beta-xylanase [Gammaproteobacteria bacterium]|nr:endo-1,4-beta-xylanase [Gammaproteobacteria bacterium]
MAKSYKRFLDVVLARKAAKSLTTWGITDRHSWLSKKFPRSDGEPTRGLLYDAEYQRKPV